jgi:hypothetical protein
MKSNQELAAELVEVRQAIRDLVALESRFKPPSFERSPMPALQKILAGEVVATVQTRDTTEVKPAEATVPHGTSICPRCSRILLPDENCGCTS